MAESVAISKSPTASRSPPPPCAICLGTLNNRCFSDTCFHEFCFTCLLEWSKVKAECPLCKKKFKSIVHSIKPNHDFETHFVETRQEEEETQFFYISHTAPVSPLPGRHRFQFRTTFTVNRHGQNAIQQILTHTLNNNFSAENDYHLPTRYDPIRLRIRRRRDTTEFRRYVYENNLWADVAPDITGRYRDITPAFYRDNEAARARLAPWLNRELNALVNGDVQDVVQLIENIMEYLHRHHITSRTFRTMLYRHLGQYTDHFVHEFYTFMRSPFDMSGHDRYIQYLSRPASPTPIISDDDDSDDVIIVNDTPEVIEVTSTDDDDVTIVASTSANQTGIPLKKRGLNLLVDISSTSSSSSSSSSSSIDFSSSSSNSTDSDMEVSLNVRKRKLIKHTKRKDKKKKLKLENHEEERKKMTSKRRRKSKEAANRRRVRRGQKPDTPTASSAHSKGKLPTLKGFVRKHAAKMSNPSTSEVDYNNPRPHCSAWESPRRVRKSESVPRSSSSSEDETDRRDQMRNKRGEKKPRTSYEDFPKHLRAKLFAKTKEEPPTIPKEEETKKVFFRPAVTSSDDDTPLSLKYGTGLRVKNELRDASPPPVLLDLSQRPCKLEPTHGERNELVDFFDSSSSSFARLPPYNEVTPTSARYSELPRSRSLTPPGRNYRSELLPNMINREVSPMNLPAMYPNGMCTNSHRPELYPWRSNRTCARYTPPPSQSIISSSCSTTMPHIYNPVSPPISCTVSPSRIYNGPNRFSNSLMTLETPRCNNFIQYMPSCTTSSLEPINLVRNSSENFVPNATSLRSIGTLYQPVFDEDNQGHAPNRYASPPLRYSPIPPLTYSPLPPLRYSPTPPLRFSITPALRYSPPPRFSSPSVPWQFHSHSPNQGENENNC